LLSEKGALVKMVMPEKVKTDFNDVLKEEGMAAIQHQLLKAKILEPAKTEHYWLTKIIRTQHQLSSLTFAAQERNSESLTEKLFNNPALLRQMEAALSNNDEARLKEISKMLCGNAPSKSPSLQLTHENISRIPNFEKKVAMGFSQLKQQTNQTIE